MKLSKKKWLLKVHVTVGNSNVAWLGMFLYFLLMLIGVVVKIKHLYEKDIVLDLCIF